MTTNLDRLLAGNRRYLDGLSDADRVHNTALATEGQAPETLVIGCCDSRIPPERITDSAPGQLFVVRSIGAMVPPYGSGKDDATAAALEYGVKHLRVRDIVVLGHSDCGGVAAARASVDGPEGDHHLTGWLDILRHGERGTAITRTQSDKAAEYEAIRLCLDNLATYPFVAEAVAAGHLSLAGCHIDTATGQLDVVTTWQTPA